MQWGLNVGAVATMKTIANIMENYMLKHAVQLLTISLTTANVIVFLVVKARMKK